MTNFNNKINRRIVADDSKSQILVVEVLPSKAKGGRFELCRGRCLARPYRPSRLPSAAPTRLHRNRLARRYGKTCETSYSIVTPYRNIELAGVSPDLKAKSTK